MYISRRSNRAILMLVGLFSFYSQIGFAGNDQSDFGHMTLNGLQAIAIEVDGIHRDFTRFGLDSAAVLQTTTKALGDNGIDVVDLERAKSIPDAALMRIKLNANQNQYGFYYYGISIQINRKISLNNSANGFISATIWQEGNTGIVMPTELRKINALVSDLLAIFINDYQVQNPNRVSSVH
jgi:hypothetical protein